MDGTGGSRRQGEGLAAAALLTLALAACTSAPPPPATADLAAALLPRSGDTPPPEPEGACWAPFVTPAVIETRTEQLLDRAERRAADGTLIAPAAFRSVTRQVIVADRQEVWAETPCPDRLTPETVATLQRALKARGLYLLPLSGAMDAPTRAAVRAWQAPRGLDSDVLTMAAARALGVIAAPRPAG